MEAKFTSDLIAPCGMNCGVCKAYLAYSRGVPKKKGQVSHCSGCRIRGKNCAFIKRDCPKKVECPDMPCPRLTKLNAHYSARYSMSMIENLNMINEKGMDEFLKSQTEKYRCPNCGDVVSVHDGKCYACGYQGQKPKQRVSKSQWDKARWVPDTK
jgi:hypothetical protein